MRNANEEKSDGLEIVSIGKLYTGPWEKKYWSSSRGKDRYPYPVEFKAVRTQNGITYKMEIFEGLKGPLFMISSTDGLSCSGQTPDIAWESFQKKSCSQMKFWHGKRFSCKIDGMEFFGFKNAFVQRLLRELVANVGVKAANVGAMAANDMLPTGICTDASEIKDSIEPTDTLPYLEKPQIRGRRGRKETVITPISMIMTDLKRGPHLSGENNIDSSSCKKRSQAKYNDKCSSIIPAWDRDNELINSSRGMIKSANLEAVIEEQELLCSARDDLYPVCLRASDHLKVDDCFLQEERNPLSSGNLTTIKEDRNLPKEHDPLDQPKVSAGHQLNSLVTEDENEKRMCPKTVCFSEPCVPDTLDHSSDSWKLKDVHAIDMDISEVLAMESESLREDEIGTAILNASNEKGDLDSIGQEIAKSMMTVLLPRAIPLLKTFPRKRIKKNVKPLQVSTPTTITANIKTETVPSPAVRELEREIDLDQNKKAPISDRNHEDYSQVKLVVPDSFDDYDSGSLVDTKPLLLPDAAVDDETLVCPDTCSSDTCFDVKVENSIINTETTGSKANIPCTTDSILFKGPQGGDGFIPKSSSGFTFPDKEDNFANSSKNSLCVGKEPSHGDQDLDFDMLASCPMIQRSSCSGDMKEKKEVKDSSTGDDNPNLKHESGRHDLLKLVGCYIHPMPISTVLMNLVGNEIYICVLSGSAEQEDKILFVYNTPITGEKRGHPFFVGHASVNLPKYEDAFGNKISVDSSAIQFTPDGQSLVLLNSIKVPCCREGNLNCPCPACTSDCIENNAIKIVHVEVGYISVVSKLKTAQAVHCILVCEPNYLVATEDSGKLHLWMMNSRWSALIEECHLPLPDNMPSHQVELKKIPQSPVLILGHNGFGEFSLWNIEKRILVSRFSAPNMSICKCIPICSLDWERKGSVDDEYNQEKLINDILDTTKLRLSGSDIQLTEPTNNEDGVVWLLISTVSRAEFEDAHQSGGLQMNSVGCWRVALLVEDMVVVGSPLDISAAAAGASAGHGVIGRSDGVVYMWELSTGMKVGNLHHFKGSGVSCIATDNSNSGLAIASEGGELLVYINPRRASAVRW